MGLVNSNDTGNSNSTGSRLSTFYDMRTWKTVQKEANGELANCSAAEFGNDPWPGMQKQCFCEPRPQYNPNYCAKEGQNCMCSGTVIFGVRSANKQVPMDIDKVLELPYTVNTANKSKNVRCSAKSFEGVDPHPGADTGCYCDNDNLLHTEEDIQNVKELWRNVALEKDARETQIRAEAEAASAAKAAAEAEAANAAK